MSSPSDEKEQSSGYFLDPENVAEMIRLLAQEDLLNQALGGLLPEQPEGLVLRSALDLACGPGGWVLSLAREHPDIDVLGVDISELMTEYAIQLARVQRLKNAHFLKMDVSQPMMFTDAQFDLINIRYLIGFLPAKRWPALFQECYRLLRPGGIFRVTDIETGLISTNPIAERMTAWLIAALWRAGHSFAPNDHTGKLAITAVVPNLFRQTGYIYQGSRSHLIEISTNTPYHNGFVNDFQVLFKLSLPFFIGTGVVTQQEFDEVYANVLQEMESPDFLALRDFHTFWGIKPR